MQFLLCEIHSHIFEFDMWPRINDHRRSRSKTLENKWERREEQQSTGSNNWRLTGLPSRASYSLPARRTTNYSVMRMQCRDFDHIESTESNYSLWESHTQSQDEFADRRDQFIDEASQSLCHHCPPLKEITQFCGELAFKKHCAYKESCSDICDSGGFKAKMQQSPHSFRFALDEFDQGRKKSCFVKKSPKTPSKLLSCSELPKNSNVSNNPFTFSKRNVIFHKPSKYLRENLSCVNFSTPLMENYPSQNDIDGDSKENLPTSFFSPDKSLALTGENSFSPVSIYGRMAPTPSSSTCFSPVKKALSDEEIDLCSVQSLPSPRFDYFNEEVSSFRPMSTSHKDERKYNFITSQPQPVTSDPGEDYMKLMIH